MEWHLHNKMLDAPPGPIFFQFSDKFGQIKSWRPLPPFGVGVLPSGNPGSASVLNSVMSDALTFRVYV